MLFASVSKEVETHMLHGVSEMRRRRRRYHRVERLRRLHSNTCGAARNKLRHIVDHPEPIIKAASEGDSFIDSRVAVM